MKEFLKVFGVCICGLFLLGIVINCIPGASNKSELIPPPVKVYIIDGGILAISNVGDSDIHGLVAYIGNPTSFKGAYQAEFSDTISPKRTKLLKLTDFVNHRDGERFNPYRYAVVELWIGGGQDQYGVQQIFFR